MGKKYKRLIDQIADKQNLRIAAYKARKGNPNSIGGIVFMDHLEANVHLLSKSISDGTYSPGSPLIFTIYEPKKRTISALPFIDRVVQHAINSVIEPIFERTFYRQSYGCRAGKGTHKGAIDCQAMARRLSKKQESVWVLKTDFSGYFYNIDRVILHSRIRAKITCKETLRLIEKFVEPVGTGIPIGNLTSQLFANVYGTIADEWLLHHAKRSNFLRYMDDIVIFGRSQKELLSLQWQFEAFCKESMKLNLSHWNVQSISRGVNFLGYRIWPTHKLLRKQSVVTAKKKIKRYSKAGRTNDLKKFLASWRGHAKWADSKNLIKSMEKLLCEAKRK